MTNNENSEKMDEAEKSKLIQVEVIKTRRPEQLEGISGKEIKAN